MGPMLLLVATGVGVLATVCAVVLVVALRRRGASVRRDPRRVLVCARAHTRDGATAQLRIEAVLDGVPSAGNPHDVLAERVRRRITDHPVAALPSVGDAAGFVGTEVSGIRVAHAMVVASDVEVTPELRRLVTDRTTH